MQLSGLLLKGLGGLGAIFGLAVVVWFFRTGDVSPQSVAKAPENPSQSSASGTEIKGADKDQLPYTIHAQKSTQDQAKPDIVHMQTVDGQFARPAGKNYTVTSEQAHYDKVTKQLELTGSVQISDAPRMVAKMDKAHVDTVTKSLTSGSPVDVELENGHVTADALVADNNGERLLFKGRVKARFNQAK
jgi:LPS export ABC transporter protein LptC